MSFSIEYDNQPLNFLKKQDKHIIRKIMDKIDEILDKNLYVISIIIKNNNPYIL